MKRFYQKKDLPLEESPLTLQLQRRHTVVEGDKDKEPVVTKQLKPVSRSNSTSSIYRPPNSAKDLNSQNGYISTLATHSSGSSTPSTVVITECQLSSSWLYNNKKAQMCSTSPVSESSQKATTDGEAMTPMSSRHKIKYVSPPNHRSKRCSSCCCYTTIAILTGLAVLGIISAAGGYVYMEYFSGKVKSPSSETGQRIINKNDVSIHAKKVGQSFDISDDHATQDEMTVFSPESNPEGIFSIQFKNSRSGSNKKKVDKGSGNILRVKKNKKEINTSEPDSSTSIQMTIEPQLKGLDKEQSVVKTDAPLLVTENNSPYSKLFGLYKDLHSFLPKDISSLLIEPSTLIKLDPNIAESKEGLSDLPENITSELGPQDEVERVEHLQTSHASSDTESTKESLEKDLDSELEINHTPTKEVTQPEVPKYFFQRPTKNPDIAVKNMFDITEKNDVNGTKTQSSVEFLPIIPQISNMNADSNTNKPSTSSLDGSLDFKEFVDADLESDVNIPRGEVSGPAISNNFFQMPTKDDCPSFRNLFDFGEEPDFDNSKEQSFSRFIPHIPDLSDPNGVSDNDGIASNIDPKEKDIPQELNHPVSGTKIAVPGPLDLLRRFATETETNNKENSEREKLDRSFFLAQALERLRTLDVMNILPSSRQKADSKNSSKQKFEPKVQSEQEVVTERSTYLQKLRRHFFEQ